MMRSFHSHHVVLYAGVSPYAEVVKKDGTVIPVAYTIQEALLGGELFDYYPITSSLTKTQDDG